MCTSSGAVDGKQYIGGFVGVCKGHSYFCYSTGDVTGINEAGRFCGRGVYYTEFENCAATGKVNGDDGPYIGVTVQETEYRKETIASWSYWPFFSGLIFLIILEIIGTVIVIILKRRKRRFEKKDAIETNKENSVNKQKHSDPRYDPRYRRIKVRGLR